MKTRTSASSFISAMVTGHPLHHPLRNLFSLALLVFPLIGQACCRPLRWHTSGLAIRCQGRSGCSHQVVRSYLCWGSQVQGFKIGARWPKSFCQLEKWTDCDFVFNSTLLQLMPAEVLILAKPCLEWAW